MEAKRALGGALREGVRVYRAPELDDGTPYVWLSAGSAPAAGERAGALPYLAQAMLPVPAWRQPTEAELRMLRCERAEDVQPGRTVCIVRIADEVLAPLRAASEGAAAGEEGAPLRGAEAEALRARAAELFGEYLASREDLVAQGIRTQAGGLRTATTHPFPAGTVLIGMHVDRWHQGPYGCREHAQLAVNLAPRDRYLLFVNVPVEELVGAYGDERDGWLTMPREVARHSGGYPVVRVRVRPGEAYLAPTENLIHDVSLEGSALADVCFTARGRFRLPARRGPRESRG